MLITTQDLIDRLLLNAIELNCRMNGPFSKDAETIRQARADFLISIARRD